MAIMTQAKFDFNWLMLTLSFGIRVSEPPWVWQRTEKAGPGPLAWFDQKFARGRGGVEFDIF